ncbi:MAG: DMT family transporter [Candidatus Thermoplasmatota archaeon]|nr:DMT family transporter [Candidatus Thermoplasmatota archaeon]
MKVHPLLFGIAAAVLFGSSTPISKLFLDRISPLQLAGTLYLGAGLCLLVYRGVRSLSGSGYPRPLLGRKGNLSLVGSIIFGGILAPISLLVGLSTSSAAETSLLLNFEAVATVLLAATVFREHIGKRTSLVVVLFTAGSIVLTIDPSERLMLSPGALLIILSCVFWGLDNNLSRNISGSDPTYVVMVKGLVAGTFSLALSLVLGHGIPLRSFSWALDRSSRGPPTASASSSTCCR